MRNKNSFLAFEYMEWPKGEPSKKHKRQNHILTNTVDLTKYLPDLEFGRMYATVIVSSGKIGCISENISGPKW